MLGLDLVPAAKKIIDEKKAAEEAENADPFVREIKALIAERADSKKNKNYARADEIRNLLAEKGVTLIDTPQGTTFKIG